MVTITRENHPFYGEHYVIKSSNNQILFRGDTIPQCERYCRWNELTIEVKI